MKPKIMLMTNSLWYTVNSRLNLSKALLAEGFEVIAIAPPGDGDEQVRLQEAGIGFIPLPMDNKGVNPFADWLLLWRLFLILRHERPAAFLGYTIKPNIYGGLACRWLGIPSIHNISGLGTVFIRETWLTQLVRQLYRLALGRAQKVFFQNREDRDLFVRGRMVDSACVGLLPGSGVDTAWFAPVKYDTIQTAPLSPLTASCSPHTIFRFLLSARLLWDKGVGEFVEAARKLLGEGRRIECQLLGFVGVENRTAISRETIDAWEQEGVIRYLGSAEDVRPWLAQADCVVLPSYREGTPRSLLEAASMGRPIITTDAVGCREVVEDGLTGYLCEPRDADDLAEKMRQMMDLPADKRLAMGRRGREKMVREFDESIVIGRYLEEVQSLSGKGLM